jgi:hypothetical protein
MNINLAYLIYLSVCITVTIVVGWLCYKHGAHYLLHLLKQEKLVKAINNILLTGYYLVNIGYISWSLSTWPYYDSDRAIINHLYVNIGNILLILGSLHYLNIAIIYIYSKYFLTSK